MPQTTQQTAGLQEQALANELAARLMDEATKLAEQRQSSLEAEQQVVEEAFAQLRQPETAGEQLGRPEGGSNGELLERGEAEPELERKLTLESSVFDYNSELASAQLELSRAADGVERLLLLDSDAAHHQEAGLSAITSPVSPVDSRLSASSVSLASSTDELAERLVESGAKQRALSGAEEPLCKELAAGQLAEGCAQAEQERKLSDCSGLAEQNDEDDAFCGTQQASEANLRQLRMSTLEDVSVCGQNRHSAEAARRLFDSLCRQAQSGREDMGAQQRQEPGGRRRTRHNSSPKQAPGSSDSGGLYGSHDDSPASSSSSFSSDADLQESPDSETKMTSGDNVEDFFANLHHDDQVGLVKLVRRCNSSAGGSSSTGAANYGRTLVCSLSPTSQTGGRESQLSIQSIGHEKGQPEGDQDSALYPLAGDEVRQCRMAFRENRQLIEQAQLAATNCAKSPTRSNFCSHTWGPRGRGAAKRNELSQQQNNNNNNHYHKRQAPGLERARWADSLQRAQRLQQCARCQQRLYPVDKLELGFTRATLSIHRNCFKCQVCSTLLR